MGAITILHGGRRVGRCTFDSVCELVDLDVYDEGRRDLVDHVRFAQPFRITLSGTTLILDPASPLDMSHVVDLAWKEVTTGVAHPDGRLEVMFSDGTRIEAGPSDRYEAWECWGQLVGGRVISVPGGSLAFFPNASAAHAGADQRP